MNERHNIKRELGMVLLGVVSGGLFGLIGGL